MASFGILIADPSALAVARASLTEWLRIEGCPPDRIADLAVVISELVTNALEASRPPRARLEVTVDDSAVEIVVTNASPVGFCWAGGPPPPPTAVRGRGLHIVDRLMSGLEIGHHEGTTRVRSWLGAR